MRFKLLLILMIASIYFITPTVFSDDLGFFETYNKNTVNLTISNLSYENETIFFDVNSDRSFSTYFMILILNEKDNLLIAEIISQAAITSLPTTISLPKKLYSGNYTFDFIFYNESKTQQYEAKRQLRVTGEEVSFQIGDCKYVTGSLSCILTSDTLNLSGHNISAFFTVYAENETDGADYFAYFTNKSLACDIVTLSPDSNLALSSIRYDSIIFPQAIKINLSQTSFSGTYFMLTDDFMDGSNLTLRLKVSTDISKQSNLSFELKDYFGEEIRNYSKLIKADQGINYFNVNIDRAGLCEKQAFGSFMIELVCLDKKCIEQNYQTDFYNKTQICNTSMINDTVPTIPEVDSTTNTTINETINQTVDTSANTSTNTTQTNNDIPPKSSGGGGGGGAPSGIMGMLADFFKPENKTNTIKLDDSTMKITKGVSNDSISETKQGHPLSSEYELINRTTPSNDGDSITGMAINTKTKPELNSKAVIYIIGAIAAIVVALIVFKIYKKSHGKKNSSFK